MSSWSCSSSNDSDPVLPECVHDDRLNDRPYCDLDDINVTIETFSNAKYCAIHVNIHSLPRKCAGLRNTLSKLKDNGILVHFVLLCETFLIQLNADKYSMPGYNVVHASRTSLSRGGVAIYILKGLNFKERPDICINIGPFVFSSASRKAAELF